MLQTILDMFSGKAEKAQTLLAPDDASHAAATLPICDAQFGLVDMSSGPEPQAWICRASDLDEFIALSDSFGGPESPKTLAYWRGFQYQPSFDIDTNCDPYSKAYVEQQIKLWEEISARPFNQDANEICDFPFDEHLNAANPYASQDVSDFARHLASLANVAIVADLPVAPRILDLGCGWGLTSEVLAFLGAEVTAMDIGQGFVDLVNARGKRSGLPIQAYRSNFDHFEPFAVFDMVLFYECLHHAVRPWDILERFRHHLGTGGKIVLAREPVQELWWPNWGIRLDPLSIYCIRKFGWFESGLSLAFLKSMAARLGLELQERPDPSASVPIYILQLGTEPQHRRREVPLRSLMKADLHEGWAQESESRLVAARQVTINLSALDGEDHLELELENNRGRPLKIIVRRNDSAPLDVVLRPGTNTLRTIKEGLLFIQGEIWCPAEELDLPDPRTISFHLVRAETYSLPGR